MAESPHAGSHSWTQRGHFAEDAFVQSPYGGDLSFSQGSQGSYGEEAPQAAISFDEDGWPSCGACGAYPDEGASSTDTESYFELVSASVEEWQNYPGSFDGTSLFQLREE